ncbi:hypothetical protein [Brevundimonas sp.]|uniref:hypothetical protein n=1 Tax=Brevundimonas sp. TaxID=1871086 RepID=UPI002737BEB9|nr:hypothetical protein [Brevundimonas sp.]MDP3800980.1 hypothetical protein [Brevundimonas sp.]
MRMLAVGAAVALSGCASASWSGDAVTRFVDRADMCAHWSGEEPYDEARRAGIDQALSDMRCATLLRDGAALRLSRKDRPDDVRRIDMALSAF